MAPFMLLDYVSNELEPVNFGIADDEQNRDKIEAHPTH